MAEEASKPARVELKAPDVQFTAEGAPEWLAQQLDKVLAAMVQLRQGAPAGSKKA